MLWQIAVCVAIVLIIRALFSSSHPHLDKLPGPRRWPILGTLPMFIGLSDKSISYSKGWQNTCHISVRVFMGAGDHLISGARLLALKKKITNFLSIPGYNMFEGLVLLAEIFTEYANLTKKYGPRVISKFFSMYSLQVYDPKDIEIVLSNSKNITKNTPYEFLKPWLGTGILTSTGSDWHKRRKVVTQAFRFDILKIFERIFEEQSRNMVDDLQSRLQRGDDVLDVMPFMSDYTLYTICETAMGTRLNSGICAAQSEYKDSILNIGEAVIKRFTRFWLFPDLLFYLSPTGNQFKKDLEQNSLFTKSVIEDRKKKRQKDDEELTENGKKRLALLDLLLEAEDKGEIDMAGIIDEVNSFMFAGHDTSSLALSFGLAMLAEHEDVQERVYEECKSIFGESSRSANTSDLAEMKYLEAVIKETMRVYPSVPFIGRSVTEDFMLGDLRVPRGTELSINIYGMHHRPDLFPEPEVFRPERFLSGDKMGFTYVPFSAGPRGCLGQRFAMQEMKYMMSAIVRNFRITPIKKGFRPIIKANIVLRPEDPILVKFSPRNSPK